MNIGAQKLKSNITASCMFECQSAIVSSSHVPSFSFTSLLLLLHRSSSCNNSVNCTAVDYKIEDLVSFAQSVLIESC